MDEIDQAQDLMEKQLSAALAKHRESIRPGPIAKGTCYHCDAVLDDLAGRFCGFECRDDWQAAQEAARRNGRQA